MAKAQATAAKPPEDGSGDSPLDRFSRELATRYPKAMIKRFVMPKGVRNCAEVFFRETRSNDEIEGAIMAEAMMSPIERASDRLAQDAQRREVIRLSLVGIGDRGPNGITSGYRHVNHDGIPLAEINDWTAGAWTALHAYFAELNGVPTSELRSGIAEARTVGAFAPPTNETPQSA